MRRSAAGADERESHAQVREARVKASVMLAKVDAHGITGTVDEVCPDCVVGLGGLHVPVH